jgi:hypothetical protein
MTTIFDLPANILSTIYEMDSTYRGGDTKMRDEINKEIFKKSFDIFREKYIKNKKYPQIVADKIDVLLKFVFEKKLLSPIDFDLRGKIFPDEIKIYTNYSPNCDIGRLYVCVSDKKDILFEADVYTIIEYNERLDEYTNDTNCSKRTRRYFKMRFEENTVLQNEKFVINEIFYDNYDSDNNNCDSDDDK